MSTISASTTSTTAYKVTADTTGTLVLQTGSTPTTAVTIDTAQNVGIGTTSPANRLSIGAGSFASATSQTTGMYTNGTSGLVVLSDAYSFNSRTGTGFMTIDASGNLGVGVTPSAWASGWKALQLGGVPVVGSSTDFMLLINNAYYDGASYRRVATGFASRYVQSGGLHYWETAGSSTANSTVSFTQAMTLDASGNLLLGVTSGTNRLVAQASSGTTPIAQFANASSSGNVACIATSIESNGNNTSSYHLRSTTQNVNIWQLFGNGTSSWSSDERLKKNIETTRNGYIDDLCRLRVVKYNWHNQDDGAPKELGLIAQEVEQVFPGLVQEVDDGTVLNGVENTKVLKGSVLPFMLLKAIQEQQAIIETLTNRITALEGAE